MGIAVRKGSRGDGASQYFPYVLFAVTLVVMAAALPTALRPPQQPPSSTAELSPDAPPDESVDAIISSLGRGQSGAGGTPIGDVTTITTVPGPPPPPSFCPGGFGGRQAESLYSAPCAPAFVGDNGGATYKGVTATEVRIALIHLGHMQAEDEGPIPTEPSSNEDDQTRTFRVFQEYLNRNFQFYGRRLVLVETKAGGSHDSPADARAAAIKADEEYHVFGCKCHDPAATEEMARRGLVAFTGITANGNFLARNQAYLWMMDQTKSSTLMGEYLCKKLEGKPPAFNERQDPRFNYDEPRIFGLTHFEKEWTDPKTLRDRFAECGGTFKVDLEVTIDPASSQEAQSNLATAVSRMYSEGVTTIVHFGTSIELGVMTQQADKLGYFPEWVTPGGMGVDKNEIARYVHSPTQWRHAFGITPSEIARPLADTGCVRAYRSIDPNGTPDADLCGDHYGVWGSLLQLANGIQTAGPNLTPDTFRQGLHSMGKRPPEPRWSIGGGYGPGDWSYGDYVAELWWDPNAIDPIDGTSRGAYRYTRGGQRYTVGEIPEEDPLVFQDGVTTVQ